MRNLTAVAPVLWGTTYLVTTELLPAGRPLLAINPRATMRYLLDQRRPLYEEVATVTVKTDGRTPQDVAAEARAALNP